MATELLCWNCGQPLGDEPLPLSRQAECRHCSAELHVCRMCVDFDTTKAHDCREPMAEEVKDKERANFCGYFAPSADAYQPPDDSEARAAEAELAKLFGEPVIAAGAGESGGEEDPLKAAEDLFRSGDD